MNSFSYLFIPEAIDITSMDAAEESSPLLWPLLPPAYLIPSGPFRRPKEDMNMTMNDIAHAFIPVLVDSSISNRDWRLSIQRPFFAGFNSLDEFIVHCKSLDKDNAQTVIAKNAKRAFREDPQGSSLDMRQVDQATRFANEHGLIALLRQKLYERKPHMVQCINPDTMIPPHDGGIYNPPYPSQYALEAMRSFHKGIPILIDPSTLVPPSFRPRDVGLDLSAERAITKQVRLNTMVVLFHDDFVALCEKDFIRKHLSDNFGVRKDRKDPKDIGRFIINFKKSGVNSPASKRFYERRDGSYDDFAAVMICILILEEIERFPEEDVFLCVCDIAACFTRIPVAPEDMPMLATHFMKDGRRMVAIPTGAPFGCGASNTTQKSLSEAIQATLRRIDIDDLGYNKGGIYIDDLISARIHRQILHFFRTRSATCNQFEGLDSISDEKSKFGQIVQVLGYLFNTIAKTISVSDSLIEKYIWAIFHLIPIDAIVGSSITLETAQIVTSYLHIFAMIVRPLQAHCKGLARATRAVEQKAHSIVYLSDDCMIDIIHHRSFASRWWNDCRCLSLPIALLPVLIAQHNESREELSIRQRAQADCLFIGDATGISLDGKTYGDGWVVVPPGTTNADIGSIIIDYDHRIWPALFEHPFKDKFLNIAILEMITTLRGLYAYLYGDKSPKRKPSDKPLHIHALTDNHVSYHRLLKNKASHSFVPYLLRFQSHLQQDCNVLITYGTISTTDNRFTDDLSRDFQTPSGPQSLLQIGALQPNRLCPPWLATLQQQLNVTPPARSVSHPENNTRERKHHSVNLPSRTTSRWISSIPHDIPWQLSNKY